jgi:hypothetical protein
LGIHLQVVAFLEAETEDAGLSNGAKNKDLKTGRSVKSLFPSPVKVENHLKGATLHDWTSNAPSMPRFPPDFGDFRNA